LENARGGRGKEGASGLFILLGEENVIVLGSDESSLRVADSFPDVWSGSPILIFIFACNESW
jgi:hypothetical protein